MDILGAATLVAIFIKCITASTDDMSQFREAVDEGNMDKAVKLYPAVWQFEREMRFKYVVDTRDQEFIFEFAKRTEVRKVTLLIALSKKPPKMIEEAFKVFKFDQDDLKGAAF